LKEKVTQEIDPEWLEKSANRPASSTTQR
jgi:hypothetical protein